MSAQQHAKIMEQMMLKLTPGMQEGETPGSLMDAMHALRPEMKMAPQSMQPGESDERMTAMMLRKWEDEHASMPDVAAWPMDREPGARSGR